MTHNQNRRSAFLQPVKSVTPSPPTGRRAHLLIVDDPWPSDDTILSQPEAKAFWEEIRRKYLEGLRREQGSRTTHADLSGR